MMLINSLLANATDTRWDEFINSIERLNVRKAVIVGDIHWLDELILTRRGTAANVVAHDRRPHVVHPRLPGEHDARHI